MQNDFLLKDHEFAEIFAQEFEVFQRYIKNTKRNSTLRKELLVKQFFGKLLTDDERAEYLGLPNGCRIRENAKIISPENFKCGEYVWIGEGAILDASGGLEIGDHTSIGLYVLIWSHSSYLTNLAKANYSNSPLIKRDSTKIGSGVFLGGPSVIYPGITIEDKTVVLPLSVVTQNFKGNCILAGTPAKVVKELPDDEIQQLIEKQLNLFDKF